MLGWEKEQILAKGSQGERKPPRKVRQRKRNIKGERGGEAIWFERLVGHWEIALQAKGVDLGKT